MTYFYQIKIKFTKKSSKIADNTLLLFAFFLFFFDLQPPFLKSEQLKLVFASVRERMILQKFIYIINYKTNLFWNRIHGSYVNVYHLVIVQIAEIYIRISLARTLFFRTKIIFDKIVEALYSHS